MGISEVQVLFHTFDGIEVYCLLYIGGELSREARGPILGSVVHPIPTQTKWSLPWPGSQEITGIPTALESSNNWATGLQILYLVLEIL